MTHKPWRFLMLFTALAGSCSTYARDIRVEAAGDPRRDYDTVNGSIVLGTGAQAGDLDSVNGGIRLESDSRAGEIGNVNGGVRLGDRVQVRSIDNVNGGIEAGAELRVDEDIESVNGGIELGRGARIAGGISAVNGGIELDAARVGGLVEINHGTLDTGRESRLEGGIAVRKSKGWGDDRRSRPPRVIVGPGSQVDGEILLERETELYVHESASIGAVKGGSARRYGGDAPP